VLSNLPKRLQVHPEVEVYQVGQSFLCSTVRTCSHICKDPVSLHCLSVHHYREVVVHLHYLALLSACAVHMSRVCWLRCNHPVPCIPRLTPQTPA
jgi:hypothetical protein